MRKEVTLSANSPEDFGDRDRGSPSDPQAAPLGSAKPATAPAKKAAARKPAARKTASAKAPVSQDADAPTRAKRAPAAKPASKSGATRKSASKAPASAKTTDAKAAKATRLPEVQALVPGAEAQIGAASGEAVHDESAFAGLIRHTLSEDKAEDIVVIDLAGKSSLTDLMVIASGRSARHVGALSDHLVQILKEHGVAIPKVEGMPNCDWVLIDAGDAIVHIFRPEVRAFYNLERIWSPAPVVPMQAAAN